MALRIAASVFAALALILLAALFFGVMRGLPGQDPQTILGGYSPFDVDVFFAGLTLEQRQSWRAGTIYLDFPFIVCAGLAGYLTFASAHGFLRILGMFFVFAFVFLDALEDFQLLSRLEPFLLDGWVLFPPISQEKFWLGWVTSAKFGAFFAMVICAVPAIWQRPKA